MPETNDARTEYVIKDINERIKRENDVIGFNTTSSLQGRLDVTDELIQAFDPAIKGIDAKIVSIGQSINQLKDEIIVLVTNAVGVATTNVCIAGVSTACGVGTTGWNGGISTCLTGYAVEYYDTVTANIWGFSSTSSNPFSQSTAILSSASNTFGVGVGTFLFVTQNNSSYSAGARVSLGSSASCIAIQNEINRKDGEISTLRGEFGKYIGVVNSLREQRWKSQLEKWGIQRAQQESESEKTRLVGVLTAFTDSTYTSLFLR